MVPGCGCPPVAVVWRDRGLVVLCLVRGLSSRGWPRVPRVCHGCATVWLVVFALVTGPDLSPRGTWHSVAKAWLTACATCGTVAPPL